MGDSTEQTKGQMEKENLAPGDSVGPLDQALSEARLPPALCSDVN